MSGNPQLEDGYFKVANEIADAFARVRLEGSDFNVLWFILRKTWGWRKKIDKISLSQIAEATELSKSVVCRALNRLKNNGIIERSEEGTRLNKRYTTWAVPHMGHPVPSMGQLLVPQTPPTSPTDATKPVPPMGHTKDNKDTKQNTREEHAPRKVFQKPTAQEVRNYALTIGFDLDGQYFVDKQDAVGWMRGKTPIKDWRAVVRTWKSREHEFKPQNKHEIKYEKWEDPWKNVGKIRDSGGLKRVS